MTFPPISRGRKLVSEQRAAAPAILYRNYILRRGEKQTRHGFALSEGSNVGCGAERRDLYHFRRIFHGKAARWRHSALPPRGIAAIPSFE
ncbi:hypothetical protein HMPREF7215_1636 [Pyramidobacter piscolens W5455]|uniref:Uncharacterized protein n=2 Tax=Pyramidobacter piscolens TaxID=638849 RepID=A0ABM9ZWC5_9BACT|nr:hypothetical protein [uncultured Pyramidobacter sp.]EFB91168.1 hypothetical protein HMPREF7215_1636 [Pyramidobacter piscolens W5455]